LDPLIAWQGLTLAHTRIAGPELGVCFPKVLFTCVTGGFINDLPKQERKKAPIDAAKISKAL